MYRQALKQLTTWKTKNNRKPLILRGARQVGKSYLAHEFARTNLEGIAEINFERKPELAALFSCNDPHKTVRLLELQLNTAIKPGKTLLFLDEIQATPEVLPTLRYFYELMPELHVLAAGSLLEFALSEALYSMPVGRIEYLYLGPMQFEEFLLAAGEERLVGFLNAYEPASQVPEPIHERLLGLFRIFLVVGGMPGAVEAYFSAGSVRESEAVKQSILTTLKDDFSKYGERVKRQRLHKLFAKIPALVGGKFKYSHVDRGERSDALAHALDLLCMARLAYRVRQSSANGIPLAAEADDGAFKLLFLDTGLRSAALGLSLLDFEQADDILQVDKGAACEQAVGQHLLYSLPCYQEPELYYWTREKKNSSAEIDYLINEGTDIVPIEVKAGKTGTLKSLHLFLREKKRGFAVRFNSGQPSLLDATTSLPDGKNVPFKMLSLPLYMAGQARRLAGTAMGRASSGKG